MRGALLIIVAVLLGAGLLANGFRDDHVASGSGTTPTTTKGSTVPGTSVPVVQAHDPAQVKVLVLNGSGKSGVAKTAKDQLAAANYTVLEPGNVSGGTITASIVYFVPGYDADAGTVAAKLGLAASAAQPLPNPLPASVADAQGANIVVIIGTDAPVAGGAGAGAGSATTTTVAAN
ncbi:MAG: LytR cell envelope-related transcriptional attenuator [Acidimicrobiaceae bacterium]|jgi:hypothetical protein